MKYLKIDFPNLIKKRNDYKKNESDSQGFGMIFYCLRTKIQQNHQKTKIFPKKKGMNMNAYESI